MLMLVLMLVVTVLFVVIVGWGRYTPTFCGCHLERIWNGPDTGPSSLSLRVPSGPSVSLRALAVLAFAAVAYRRFTCSHSSPFADATAETGTTLMHIANIFTQKLSGSGRGSAPLF